MNGGQLQWTLASRSAGFGNLLDGQHPLWVGDFGGTGRVQLMFYYTGDGNWWLGNTAGGSLQWTLVGNSVGFGSLTDGKHPTLTADFTGAGHAQLLFYYAGDGNWWLGDMAGGQLQWTLVSESAGFGDLMDGQHPTWAADFSGVGHAQILFYYAGDEPMVAGRCARWRVAVEWSPMYTVLRVADQTGVAAAGKSRSQSVGLAPVAVYGCEGKRTRKLAGFRRGER